MAPQKSPAFQFYPTDFNAGTATFSLQEVGAYVRLLNHQWTAGGVPNNAGERARILGCAKSQEVALWKKVGQKFTLRNDVYLNERLEDEREKQAEYRRRQSDKGKASAATRGVTGRQPESNHGSTTVQPALQPEGQPEGNSSVFGLQSSSSEELRTTATPSRPLVSGESNPRTWGKIHGDHHPGFCDWVCLPEFIFAEFCRKSGKPFLTEAPGYVREWAAAVRSKWSGPVGDNLKFWRARWDESHPITAAPKVNGTKPPSPEHLARMLAIERGERKR